MSRRRVGCLLCERTFVNLPLHLTTGHKMSREEYLGLYPDADLNQGVLAAIGRVGQHVAYERHFKDNPEACRARVANVDWQARNCKKHETSLRTGAYERQKAKMQVLFEDSAFAKAHSEATRVAMQRDDVQAAHRAGLDGMTPEQKASWKKNLSDAWHNMTQEQKDHLTQARLASSRSGSKNERRLFELLCEHYPEGGWKHHNFIRTDDPYGTSGLRQIDILSRAWDTYIEWNGWLHYENPWCREDLERLQEIDKWKAKTVAELGGCFVVVKSLPVLEPRIALSKMEWLFDKDVERPHFLLIGD